MESPITYAIMKLVEKEFAIRYSFFPILDYKNSKAYWRDVVFDITEDHIVARNVDGLTSVFRFDVCNPSFNPEFIIKWIKKNF